MTPTRSSFPIFARVLARRGPRRGGHPGAGWHFADGLVKARPVKRPIPKTRVLAVTQEGTKP